MIIFSATMWPHGSASQSYELLHGTITNQSSPGDALDSYSAHVLARPKPFSGIEGYEADIQTSGHKAQDGLTPLLISILSAAHVDDPKEGLIIPASRVMARLRLRELADFERAVRGRA